MNNENRTAFVTGAARGIGRAIAEELAKEGCDIAAVDIIEDLLADTKKAIEEIGRKCLICACDVTSSENVKEAVEKTINEFGKIDILVNNAGITRDNLLIRMSDEEWDQVLNINLKGTFNCIRAVAKQMMKARKGAIINIASVVGVMGNPGQANYVASKAGIIGLTKSAAKELASRNITVNAIAPGFIDTDMTKSLPEKVKEEMLNSIPLKRFGNPQDIADVVSFLASEKASYITGQVFNVNGGMYM
ncbi:MAG: 3-oxoacyl-[acyl-carrier-protein] reductase [Candidatus Schekmanbacteria bacterium]|nr:MAG: 3-oxoacyl-[acyl-carrier-protein] reductase [Candidatus Schekmanbacteria bacterium]